LYLLEDAIDQRVQRAAVVEPDLAAKVPQLSPVEVGDRLHRVEIVALDDTTDDVVLGPADIETEIVCEFLDILLGEVVVQYALDKLST
jgi:hypothetical protein